jgi:hypothetical protein
MCGVRRKTDEDNFVFRANIGNSNVDMATVAINIQQDGKIDPLAFQFRNELV